MRKPFTQSLRINLCLFLFFISCSLSALAQPTNDHCAGASPLVIGNGGYSLGTVTSAQTDLTQVSLQPGETFASSITSAGLDKKSAWYKFTLPTTRAARISLAQPGGGIQAGNVGFAVYKTNSCLPNQTQLSTKFTPIEIFGSSYHPCVEAGEYLVQVSGNSNANGPIFITLDLSDTTGGAYDKPVDAFPFPSFATNKMNVHDFLVQCQTIDNAAENCLPNGSFKDFTKSTWHTFTTPAYFDWFSVLLSGLDGQPYSPDYVIGYRIYQGDSRTTPLSSLVLMGGCDSLKTNGYYPDRKIYRCGELQPNTTYTVQLLYHTDFVKTLRLAVAWNGSAATTGSNPTTSLPAPNNIGILPTNSTQGGQLTMVSDHVGCNSRHSVHNCPKSMPVGGVVRNGLRYTLSTFFSFTLAGTSTLRFTVNPHCGPEPMVRLYKQTLTANCADLDTSNIISVFGYNSGSLSCLEPGNYVLQVMGVDSSMGMNSLHWSSLHNSTTTPCLQMSLGSKMDVSIYSKSEVAINHFALNAPGKFEKINANAAGVMQPLVPGTTYVGQPDTLGCANTVLPDDEICQTGSNEIYTKAVYRQFVVVDSVMLYVPDYLSSAKATKIFKGDANALATAQSAYNHPQKITGLQPYSGCFSGYSSNAQNACLTPGTYTIANFDNRLGYEVTSKFTIAKPVPKFNAPAKAEDMGNVWQNIDPIYNLVRSAIDTFSCYDNPLVIDGVNPCLGPWSVPTTKQIYRQFYLDKPTIVSIYSSYSYTHFAGLHTLFSGKATDGVAQLRKVGARYTCFTSVSGSQCDALPAGWYTVVSYGTGPSYSNPIPNNPYNIQSSDVGRANAIFIQLTVGCPKPKFNRPHKASVDTLTGQPYKIEWGPQPGHTAAYPITAKKYTLNAENFDCSQDTSFINHHMQACSADNVKVSFYVFQLTQESYVQVGQMPYDFVVSMYNFDVRGNDSIRLRTDAPLQSCLTNGKYSEFCKLQPGIYTLVIYGSSAYSTSCIAVTPTIYVDQVGTSRFDHAAKAYDFGVVLPDSTWRNGKPGDVNPLEASRAPSNDFFYCTTGAQNTDPAEAACMSQYNPNIYNAGTNVVLHPDNTTAPHPSLIDRRNLWYTFNIEHPGKVRIRVSNKTTGKMHQYPFAIYKSDVDGALPFTQVVNSGQVDSTFAQGLTFIARNHNGGQPYAYCSGPDEIEFLVPPCTFKASRFYIVVENRNTTGFASNDVMNPNSQVEVSVLFDSVGAKPAKFDHYANAYDMGTINTGIVRGETDNFTCATRALSDPINYTYVTNCNKTLWYKFTTATTGQIRYAAFFKNRNESYYDHVQLFKQVLPGDSTSRGLKHLLYTSTHSNNGNWAQRCIEPGTYYLLLPGCNALDEDVYPQVEIIPQAGDFCSAPMITNLNGPGTRVVPVLVDCHTIGTDYGEFNPTLTCPANATTSSYKTSWYRLDITGTDTLDVTVFINENTNASSTDIKYRMMTGSCGAMQEQSCVQDALTRNTYKCLAPGNSYYIQVFTPIMLPNTAQVTGTIDLNISAVIHADSCLPANNCIGVANFTPKFDCTKDKNVQFTNFSTYGSAITYEWNFGHNNQTSNAVSPSYFYPALTTDATYTVKLVITNTTAGCNKKDSSIQTITIPARPSVNLGNDTIICTSGSAVALDATSHPGSTYYWYHGSVQPTATFNGTASPWVEVTYNGCKARDTINIWINPISKRPLQTRALCNVTTVALDAYRGQGEQYAWSTGASTSSITVAQPGYYWVDLYLNGCTIRDSFMVVSANLKLLGNDTTICQRNMPYTANATVNGASSYKWQDNSTSPTFTVTQPGQYWVEILLGGCTFRDTIEVSVDSFRTVSRTEKICEGQTYTLPSGVQVSTAGLYRDTLRNGNGCDTLISNITLQVDDVVRINTGANICAGQTYTLPSGVVVNMTGTYADTVRYASGCDSLITTINLTVKPLFRLTNAAAICEGQTYTLPSGVVATTTGAYSDTVRYITGCDSLISTTNLTVTPVIRRNTNASICEGQTYTLPSGMVVTAAGFYADTVKYIAGCDSLISSVTLAVNMVTRTAVSASVCEGQSYTLPSGSVVSTSGTFVDTLHYTSGCDSLITTTSLTVKPLLRQTNAAAICEGQTYTLPSGVVVTTTGAYSDTVRYISGCDSLITTTNLTVTPIIRRNTNASICEGQTYTLPSGTVVTAAGFYADTVKYIAGCDSLISSVTLAVNMVTRTTVTASVCEGQSYTLPSGSVVSTSGTFVDTLHYTSGCDSVITTTSLTVKPLLRQINAAAICEGQTYTLPSGVVVNTTGAYSDTVRYISGCDSLITTTNLTVTPVIRRNTNASICEGQSYTLLSGMVVTAAGFYADTVRYVTGCDSLISSVTLAVNAVTRTAVTASVCEGQAYTLPSGSVVSTSGTFVDTLYYTSGCDSVITTTSLTVKPLLRQTNAAAICEGQTFTLPSGVVVNTTGTYSDTVRYTTGCDSLITTINLLVKPVSRQRSNAVVCAGQAYTLPSGAVVNTAGIYNDTLRYSTGCDSVINTIHLTVQQVVRQTFSVAVCAGQGYTLPSGTVVNSTGTFIDTAAYSTGCDSLISTITITLRTVERVSAAGTICQGQVYTLPSGNTVNATGVYSDTLRYTTGCDSIITTLNLVVRTVTRLNTSAAVCSGATYTLPSGTMVNASGLYSDTIRYNTGCDSLITILTLLVKQPVTNIITPAICTGETYTLPSGMVVNTAGTYTDVVKDVTGCDSIVTNIRLSINPNPIISISKTNDINCIVGSATLTASGGRTYLWTPSTSLSNAVTASTVASPAATTNYKVTVTTNRGCTASDSITLVVDKGDADGGYLLPSAFTPNGDGKNDCFGVKSWGWVSDLEMQVFDRWGSVLFATSDPSKCWDGTSKGHQVGTGTYVYYIKAITTCGPVIRKGTIVLIR
ncbi:gliding motility-associated C-terminal domain-containing protein [Aridibaculum aurantiacum]|uniref:gliding motility-associated C-terminal domain-containing protein n=1 Tax=Aridibaculum aurantiacum TaxID=2810307 RepID=UPI001A963C00|nr:gliding motility-associated C-terminal domain-containing protein [Aridibaculum aurantiacum]